MRLTLAEPKYLKDSIAVISDLVNEANFKIKPEGIELVAMDPANVAMVMFKLLSSSFTEYEVEKELDLAINLSNLKQILRRVNTSDMLTLTTTDDNKLKIQVRGATTRTFSLPIIDTEGNEQKIPELNFPVTVSMPSTMLAEAIEDVGIVAESVTFNASANEFHVSAEGDLNHASIKMEHPDSAKITYTGDTEEVHAKYSIEYLKKMVSGGKVADEVSVMFSKDYPLKLDFKTLNKVALSFILAPRVEND